MSRRARGRFPANSGCIPRNNYMAGMSGHLASLLTAPLSAKVRPSSPGAAFGLEGLCMLQMFAGLKIAVLSAEQTQPRGLSLVRND